MNAALTSARRFDSNFNERERQGAAPGSGVIKPACAYGNWKILEITTLKPSAGQSERFSDIGAARRGLGAVCCPAAE
jgi:hypothetical protein